MPGRKTILLPVLLVLFSASVVSARMTKTAPALPAPTGNVVRVSTVTELQQAVSDLVSGTTILVEPGEYKLSRTLVFDGVDSVSLRGATGRREDVILRGGGMLNQSYQNTVPHVILVMNANDILIADLTVADAWYHNIQLAGSRGPIRPRVYNVHSLDCGEQHLKVNPGVNPTAFPDSGRVEFCRFEFSDRAKHDYTNGIDVLDGANWVVSDCEFVRIRAPRGELAGGAILFWKTCYNTVVERCFFEECDAGIIFGLYDGTSLRSPGSQWDHVGGVIRNNVIYRQESGDVGISVQRAKDFKIYNNTVILNGTFLWNIEYRFSSSSGEVRNNLADGAIVQRDGAVAVLSNNLTNAVPGWFVAQDSLDLHLNETAVQAIGKAMALDDVTDDWDGHPRGETPDIGADEYDSRPPGIRGDINEDGKVDIFDLLSMLRALGSGQWEAHMDLDGDGKLTIFDLLALLRILSGQDG